MTLQTYALISAEHAWPKGGAVFDEPLATNLYALVCANFVCRCGDDISWRADHVITRTRPVVVVVDVAGRRRRRSTP